MHEISFLVQCPSARKSAPPLSQRAISFVEIYGYINVFTYSRISSISDSVISPSRIQPINWEASRSKYLNAHKIYNSTKAPLVIIYWVHIVDMPKSHGDSVGERSQPAQGRPHTLGQNRMRAFEMVRIRTNDHHFVVPTSIWAMINSNFRLHKKF
jgi:hypothetical protein